MRICQCHWDALRDAIRARGLYHLVSGSGEEAAQRLTSGEFDPLMSANNLIFARALDAGGLEVLLNPGCPVCMLDVPHWIDEAAETAAEHVANSRAGHA